MPLVSDTPPRDTGAALAGSVPTCRAPRCHPDHQGAGAGHRWAPRKAGEKVVVGWAPWASEASLSPCLFPLRSDTPRNHPLESQAPGAAEARAPVPHGCVWPGTRAGPSAVFPRWVCALEAQGLQKPAGGAGGPGALGRAVLPSPGPAGPTQAVGRHNPTGAPIRKRKAAFLTSAGVPSLSRPLRPR